MKIEDLTNIKNIASWESGGGMTIDVVELNDGRVIGISEEAVILYRDMEDLMSGDPSANRPCIYL